MTLLHLCVCVCVCVCACVCVQDASGCVSSPLLSVPAFVQAYETCDLEYAAHTRPLVLGYGPQECLPLLHL